MTLVFDTFTAASARVRRRRAPMMPRIALACALVVGPGVALAAPVVEATESQDRAEVRSEQAEPGGGWWRGALGRPAPDRLYTGAWVLHLKRPADGWSQHWLLGVGWHGFFGGTFTNSHGRQSYAVGLAREVARTEQSAFAASLGYRVGVIRGYDERLHPLAGRWPVVPALEITGTIQRGRLGLLGSYAGIVASVGAFVAF